MRSVVSCVHALIRSDARGVAKTTLLGILCVAVLTTFSVTPALAAPPSEGVGCIADLDPKLSGLNCTANDTALSSPLITVIDGCDYPGDTATVQIIVDITIGAQARNDLSVWISIDGDTNGDGPETGLCSVLTVPNNILHTDGITSTLGDGDVCGDVFNVTPTDPQVTAHVQGADLGTVTLPCLDPDGDGKMNTPVIVAWNQSDSPSDCSVSSDARPGTKAKCGINLDQNIDVPIPGRITVDKQTVPVNATLFEFNLTGPDSGISGGFDGSETFSLADATAPFDTANFTGGLPAAVGGTLYHVVETANSSYLSAGVCVSDVDGTNTDPANILLRPGETVDCTFTNSELDPALATDKVLTANDDEDQSGSITENDTLTYTITVTNTGNMPLTNVVVSDTLVTPTGGTTPCAALAVNATCTLVGTYVVTAGDVNVGSITNTGTGDSTETEPVDDILVVQVEAVPALDTLKELTSNADEDQSGSVSLNDTLTYTVTVTNTGNVTLNNVVVSDTLITPTGGTTPCTTLAVGASCTLVGTYMVTQDDVDAGVISNTGTGDSDEVGPVDDVLDVPITQLPALATLKELTSNADEDQSGSVSLNDTLTYTVTVTNTGNVTLNNVVVSDTLITPTGGTTPCATLAVNATCTLVGTYVVTQDDVDVGAVVNTGTGDSDETDPVSARLNTPIDTDPALITAKELTSNADEDQSADVSLGDTLTYTITVTNTGDVTLNNVVVSDTLITPTGGTTPCATLAVNATCTLVGTYVVTQDDVNAGTISNTGTGDSDETDPVDDVLNTPVAGSPSVPPLDDVAVPSSSIWALMLLILSVMFTGIYFRREH